MCSAYQVQIVDVVNLSVETPNPKCMNQFLMYATWEAETGPHSLLNTPISQDYCFYDNLPYVCMHVMA